MTAPSVASYVSSPDSGSGTTKTINLPTGITSGDLLVIVTSHNNNNASPVSYPAGWTELFDLNSTSSISATAAYRVADGTEGSTIAITLSNDQQTAAIAWRVTGWTGTPEQNNQYNASTTNQAIPSITPSTGTDDYLYLVADSIDTYIWSVTSYPTGYINTGTELSGPSGSQCGIAFCTREVTSSTTESPSNLVINNARVGHSCIIAIQGISGGAINVTPTSVGSTWATNNYTVELTGSIDITPQSVGSTWSANNYTVDLTGEISVTPQSVGSTWTANNYTVQLDAGIVITPQSVGSTWAANNYGVVLSGVIDITPQSVGSSWQANGYTVTLSSVVINGKHVRRVNAKIKNVRIGAKSKIKRFN